MARGPESSLINQPGAFELARKLAKQSPNGQVETYNAFSGADIQAVISVPTSSYNKGAGKPPIFFLGNLQTLSISSTRSVSPVRVLGRASPVQYLKGARTVAGTLSFATINQSVFNEIYDVSLRESFSTADTSFLVDQLPPFDIVLTAVTEKGGVASQIIRQVSIINTGTTYSVDDLYTEQTYSYVALDATPLFAKDLKTAREEILNFFNEQASIAANSLLSKMNEVVREIQTTYSDIKDDLERNDPFRNEL